MNQKMLVVHSGTYKTGTSAIQLYLVRAMAAGTIPPGTYPVTGRALGMQHINLNAELRQGPVFTPRLGSWDDLIAEIVASDNATTVVSTENFSTLTREQMAVIGDKCRAAGIKVRWIHYMREQVGFYNAFYVERLVNMRPEFTDLINLPFEDFGTWSPIPMDFLDYGKFADNVLAAIPDVDLILRPYSRKHLLSGDSIADFCAHAGIAHSWESGQNANVGTGWRTVETARRLTPLVLRADLRGRTQVYENPIAARMRWVALIRSQLSRVSAELGWNEESAIYMTSEFRDVLIDRYREQNERVSAYVDFDWPAIVSEAPSKEFNVGDYASIPGDEVMAAVERVMSVVLEKPDEIKNLPQRALPSARSANPVRRLGSRVKRRLIAD